MQTRNKAARFFSGPLMKQTIKSNLALAIVIVVIMCMMSTVINFAMNILDTGSIDETTQEAQTDFYAHLYAIASYNQMAGTELSYENFSRTENLSDYDTVFEMVNSQSATNNLSTEALENSAQILENSGIPLDTYIRQFEYAYVLNGSKGCFTGEELSMEDMITSMLETMGVSPALLEDMDTTAILNQMYFTVMGLLPIFLFIVVVSNMLIASQVDSGSMAYVLSTPTKRSAVVLTQMLFMIIAPFLMISVVCAARIASTYVLYGEPRSTMNLALYLGMYVLVEAVAGICYMGSCLFDQSRKAMAFGGGLTVWFFLASLLGMFGSSNMIEMGVGVEQLSIFNKLTLVGLYDINALSTVGSGSVDMTFLWKLIVLAVVAVICYAIGVIRFQKKDLPL